MPPKKACFSLSQNCCQGNTPGTPLPSQEGGFPRGIVGHNEASKNTPKFGNTNPAPKILQSSPTAGTVFLFNVLGCRHKVLE